MLTTKDGADQLGDSSTGQKNTVLYNSGAITAGNRVFLLAHVDPAVQRIPTNDSPVVCRESVVWGD